MNASIVNFLDEPMDEVNYGYAICKCTKMHEGVKINRPEHHKFIRFDCPRCGTKLGIFLI